MNIQPQEKVSNEVFLDYFLNRISLETFRKQCKSDNKNLTNIYEAFKYAFFNTITDSAGAHYMLLGAKLLQDTITIHEYKEYEYTLPENLKDFIILQYYCNPIFSDNLHPIIRLNPKDPEKSLIIYPYKKKSEPAQAVSLTITITCIDKKIKENLISSLLLDSFKYYAEGQYRYAIIAAHSAYELSAKEFFKRLAKDKHFNLAKNFLSSIGSEAISNIALKYLPLVLSFTRKPLPPTIIINSIADLTKLRNELSHDTKVSNKTQKQLVDDILSAFFICKYFELDIPIKDYPQKSPTEDLPETPDISENDKKISIYK